jgi:hypothetical protein
VRAIALFFASIYRKGNVLDPENHRNIMKQREQTFHEEAEMTRLGRQAVRDRGPKQYDEFDVGGSWLQFAIILVVVLIIGAVAGAIWL